MTSVRSPGSVANACVRSAALKRSAARNAPPLFSVACSRSRSQCGAKRGRLLRERDPGGGVRAGGVEVGQLGDPAMLTACTGCKRHACDPPRHEGQVRCWGIKA